MIYFVQDDTAIKIGHSKKPVRRISGLQVSTSRKLKLLGTMRGGRALEQLIHLKFKHLQIRGEWFKADQELFYFIKNRKFPFSREIVTRGIPSLAHGLKYYRSISGKSQQEISRSAGIRQATLSKAEGSQNLRISTIYLICAALGLELVLRPRNREEFKIEDFIANLD